MAERDLSQELTAAVAAAAAARRPLRPVGGDTKAGLGRAVDGEPLELSGHTGIVSYEPTELVLTARAGTPLAVIEAALAERGQMLGCEPPHLGAGATLGGTVACGLSGPRRPWAGALRDFVLGVRVINGRGQLLRFGGEVIKNVAGYDLSRLLTGAQGTLGVLLEVSLRVLPVPQQETTLAFDLDAQAALERLTAWGRQPLPLSAAAHDGERLRVRLSGTAAGVEAAVASLGGEVLTEAGGWWHDLRERRLPLFGAGDGALWRLALPSAAAQPELPGSWLLDWGGAQRFVRTPASAEAVRAAAAAAGGHATCHDGSSADGPFQPLPPPLLELHRRLKLALDPQRILNPGRLYAGL
ncbi:MAG TPA: glycolate oxidase subunit GlcE [Gammaproteobacteria bacterium]